ncbi:sugar-binding transcriptional regulator [Occultella kanbiaonis]|uniref:sugar-binding transcriptional regulator n=1 Tax=Occultella kanbiaonis TaxID=2675754 RepID=UPI001B354474|nr:sugar-binding transcriptional regulator [Occultella kanbiaonis]
MSSGPGGAGRVSSDRMSLLVKIARMYHEQGLRQPEIADRLHISQSRVSRFLKEAVSIGIVRTVVVPPPGVFSELEEAVRDQYGLTDVVVAGPSTEDDSAVLAAIGGAGAAYLETTLIGAERVGISSWSASLLAVVEAMSPRAARSAEVVVQVLGGVGNPRVQVQATRLTDRLAQVTGGTGLYFPAPGVVSSATVRDALLADPYISDVAAAWSSLSVVLVGIGSVQPSPLLVSSGNALPEADLELLRGAGAVGDVCLRFFDADGVLVETDLHERILGISAEALRATPRKIGVAGGPRKFEAIRAAARGGWIDVLITDSFTARRLVA